MVYLPFVIDSLVGQVLLNDGNGDFTVNRFDSDNWFICKRCKALFSDILGQGDVCYLANGLLENLFKNSPS